MKSRIQHKKKISETQIQKSKNLTNYIGVSHSLSCKSRQIGHTINLFISQKRRLFFEGIRLYIILRRYFMFTKLSHFSIIISIVFLITGEIMIIIYILMCSVYQLTVRKLNSTFSLLQEDKFNQ